jgi:integrase/recombinase XerD
MEDNIAPLCAGETQSTESVIGKFGLPAAMRDLKIRGLNKVAASAELTPRNKELILRFLSHIAAEVSEERLTFYTHKLQRLGTWLKKDFDAATEQDIRCVVMFLSRGIAGKEGQPYSESTAHGYKVTLKRFYRWLEGNDEEYPKKVRWIKSNGDNARIHVPEQLLSPGEIVDMIRCAGNPRDKALVSFLYESGARIGETLSMKVGHLEFAPVVIRATLPVSKTQPRIIPLVSCRAHLANWINYHPLKNNPDAPLWSNLKREGNSSLEPQTAGKILKRIACRAGIHKRIYPHLFRACSITHKQAAGWPEQAIKLFHGLSRDSKVMKHYSHLSYGNLEQIQKQMNGLPSEASTGSEYGLKCPRCGKKNPLYVQTCSCGLPAEMTFIGGNGKGIESEIEARVERKINEFLENRRGYDRLMERFMSSLLEKCRRSPELLSEIRQFGLNQSGETCHPRYSTGSP